MPSMADWKPGTLHCAWKSDRGECLDVLMQLFRMESVKVSRPASHPVYCRTSTNTTSTCVLAGVGSLCVPPLSVSVKLCLRHFFPYFSPIFLFGWYTCIPTGPCGNSPLGSKQHCKRHQCDSCDHGSASNVSTCEVRSARALSLSAPVLRCTYSTRTLGGRFGGTRLPIHDASGVPECRTPWGIYYCRLTRSLPGCTAEVFKTRSTGVEWWRKKFLAENCASYFFAQLITFSSLDSADLHRKPRATVRGGCTLWSAICSIGA